MGSNRRRSVRSDATLDFFYKVTVSSLHKVQKRDVNSPCICVCFKFPGLCFCQKLPKLRGIWQKYHKTKKI